VVGVLDERSPDESGFRHLRFNGETFADTDLVRVRIVYLNIVNLEIVIGCSDCGVSACCCSSSYIIVLRVNPVFISAGISEINYNLKFDALGDGLFRLSGTSAYLKNDLGDNLPVSLIYDRKKKSILFENVLRPERDFNSLIGEHPDAFLG